MNKYLVASCIAVLAACAGQPDAQECKTGITCPEGTQCAAAQAICITGDCGDGVTQSTEACDDGNIVDGDGCSANCQSREACGDGVLNAAAGELCDDGNTTGGDGCAQDCRSVEVCGNNVRDVNEACDDGNTIPGDGCSGNCLSTEVCGNKIVDLGEKCDDGDEPGGCNPDCQGGTGCGDGAIDIDGLGNALEECDDGNTDNQDDCTDTCKLNVCGDSIIQTSGARIEQCDPAVDFGETADCNLDCTISRCGDNKINNVAGEECDLGGLDVDGNGTNLNADNKDCTAACTINVCGDTLINSLGPTVSKIEQCDDGNSVPNDACSNTCTTKACGNGIVEMGEACDDFNTANNDGCNSTCQFERCGDGLINDGEQCDGTGTASVMGTPGETATCNVNCTTRSCGDGIINKAAGEECEEGNTVDAGTGDLCRYPSCKLHACGDGVVGGTELCDDDNDINTDSCTNACTMPTCRDGILQAGEQCDDGNNVNTDGCLNTCVLATCGDMVVRTTPAGAEECDPGPTGIGADKNCTPACKLNTCGDGYRDLEDTGALDDTEACDDGNEVTEANCPYGVATCTLCDANCNNVINRTGNVCGDGVIGAPEESCDDGNAITETKCAYGAANGTCNVCNATCTMETMLTNGDFCGDGTVDTGETCDDKNLTCGRCNSTCSAQSTPAPATAILFTNGEGGGSSIGDGDYILLSDGVTTVKFEFDDNAMVTNSTTPPATAVAIDISGANPLTPTQMRDAIQSAINGASGFFITTTDLGSNGLLLTNDRDSAIGNTTITTNGLNANDFFIDAAMTGGVAGNCASGQACTTDGDCLASDGTGIGNCSSGTCQ